jgi:hypothetical protein
LPHDVKSNTKKQKPNSNQTKIKRQKAKGKQLKRASFICAGCCLVFAVCYLAAVGCLVFAVF